MFKLSVKSHIFKSLLDTIFLFTKGQLLSLFLMKLSKYVDILMSSKYKYEKCVSLYEMYMRSKVL